MSLDVSPFLLTFKLALVTTVILAVIGIPLTHWLAFTSHRLKYIIEPLVSMPLVLPPTVLGFYMLLIFSPMGGVLFTFTGLVIGSVVFSLPFMVNPIKAGFQTFPRSLIEASHTLGKSETETLFKVILPNMKPALCTGIVMAFAHTIGEFGVVLMVGGGIPGETRTASIAIFNEVESLNYTTAGYYAAMMMAMAFVILFVLNWVNRKEHKVFV